MRIEMSRTYPVPRAAGFGYITDTANWPNYLLLTLPEGRKQSWAKKGDEVEFTWKPLGVPMRGKGVLKEIVDGEHIIAEFKAGAYPPVTYHLTFENAGAHAFTLRVVATLPEPKNWLSVSMNALTMVGPLLKRDVRLMVDRLGENFMAMHDHKETVAA